MSTHHAAKPNPAAPRSGADALFAPRRRGVALTAMLLALAVLAVPARSATPASGTLSNANPTLHWTGSISGAGSGENTCVNGVSCDSFQVVLAPGDYTTLQLSISVTWTVPAYDYDLYVHAGTLSGPVTPAANGGPPGTEEHVLLAISPGVVTSPMTWWAHVQAASVPPGQTYSGTASLFSAPDSPTVTHLPGTLPFSATVPLFARSTVRDEEPSVRVDVNGNCYVGAIRGVPAGVDMWRLDLNPQSSQFDPELRHAAYLGQPDVFQQSGAEDSTSGGADGGGDIELATSFPTVPGALPVLTMVSLAVADISSSVSFDQGVTWQHNALAAMIPSDDRQWIEAYGPNTIYLFYRAPVPGATLFVQKSTDHGQTYGPAVAVVDPNHPATTTPGYIAVDQATGIVYVSHENASALYVSHSLDGGLTWTTSLVDGSSGHGHLFDPVKVGKDGTVYAAWSNERHVLYAYSTDHGVTWSRPAIVDDPAKSQTNVFPWLAAGSAGRVDVVWYGSRSANASVAEWDVYFAQSLDANTGAPTFRQQIVSDHRIHALNISEGGLTGANDRNLGDYFQIAYDPQGAAVIAFADDHNDFDGNTFVLRQLGGTSLLASANGTGEVNLVAASPVPLPDMLQPEVVDPAHDATVDLQPVPTDSPFDILSISYFANNDGPGGPFIGARMKLSGLHSIPPPGSWRIGFTANATNVFDQLPTGTSDHGDMFYLLATDSAGTAKFAFGTAYRDSSPLVPVVSTAYGMAYDAAAGVADSGAVDTATSTVSVKVAVARLNALLPPGHAPIGQGSWLTGLRGTAAQSGEGARDNTRGGQFNFYVNFRGPITGVGADLPPEIAMAAWPNPSRAGTALRFGLPQRAHVSLAIYDMQGRLVRDILEASLEAGSHESHWDGRGAGGTASAPGLYFARLKSEGREAVARLVVLR